jgi:hypothetical protein
MSYVIRYLFDPGSGACLWAANEEAKSRFGYPIAHWELPLSENTKRFLQHLVAWFDTSIDWSSPGDADDYWTAEELDRFKASAANGLQLLRQELPSAQYEFIDATAA